jgi:pimeloyl-ACP methyl ester carboxylesterase
MSTLRSRFVVAGGVTTHYTESGDNGPAIVALHGGGHGASGEAGMGPLMAILGDEFRFIAVDSVGGFGLTDPSAPVKYGLQSRVDHLADVVDALCLDRFTILGNSQGAWCAAKYATMYPDRVDHLVMLATGSITAAMGIERGASEGTALFEAYDGTRDGMRKFLSGIIFDQSKITDELVELRYSAASRPGHPDAYAALAEGQRKIRKDPRFRAMWDLSRSLPDLTKVIPAIMIWGENDVFAPPELGRELEKVLPDVGFHWIERAGHQAQTDRPELVAQIVRDFLKQGE